MRARTVPLRHRDNMLRVVPAWEAGHEWHGRHEPLPREAVDGIAVMANQRGPAEPLGVEFAPPYRAALAWPISWKAAERSDRALSSSSSRGS